MKKPPQAARCTSRRRQRAIAFFSWTPFLERFFLDPGRNALANFRARAFLDEVPTFDRDFSLVLPRPAKFARRARQDCPRIGADKELRNIILCHEGSIGFHNRDDVGGLASNRNRAGPFQCRSEEHTSELQSHSDLVCRLLLE